MEYKLAISIWDYNQLTGIFTWKIRSHVHFEVGQPAGNINNRGRVMLTFKRKKYQASLVAWLMMTGEWPKTEIDHIDGDQANNKWVNLRPATHGQNCRNQKLRKDNSLGIKGVHHHGSGFRASISYEGKRYNLGTFRTVELAKAAYDEAAEKFHGEFRRKAA